ncbi:hypothetical protein ACFQ0O_02050 [Saccharopolyspora spinosporotrichia]
MRRNSWPTDTWLVFRHALDPTLRNPFVLAIGLVQPLLYLLLFGPLLVTGLPGASWEGFLPGILVMLAMFEPASPVSPSSPTSAPGCSIECG